MPQKCPNPVPAMAPIIGPSNGMSLFSHQFDLTDPNKSLVSAVLIPVTIAPFAAGTMNPVLDATLCALIVVHSHIGFQSIIIDYVPLRRVPRARKLFEWGLRAGSLVVAAGLYEYETNDVGLTEGIKALWHA